MITLRLSLSLRPNKNERLLTIENLSLSYGDKVILRDINLHVDNIVRPGLQQGQVIALLGLSGSGKTQLFRCIAGMQQPCTGSVYYSVDELLQDLARVPFDQFDDEVEFIEYPCYR